MCCATCARPSRTGRRCGPPRCASPRRSPPTTRAGCPNRRSPRPRSCCAGWPTTTSPSWAIASTSSTTAPAGVRRPAAGRERLVAVAGTGLGILRADQSQGPDVGRLPREASDRARQRQLLVITKANSRSTVHRPAYLDYVGVKSFDDQGKVVGERRFLGLFTSAAYNESIQRDPGAAPQGDRAPLGRRVQPGQPFRQGPAADPRDLSARRAVPDLRRRTSPRPRCAVLHLQERRQLRLFLRRDDYGRFMSCMVYLPRDRYTTQVRQEMEEILLDAFDGVSIDYTALVSESVLARLHFVVRVDPKRRRARRRPGRDRGAAGRARPGRGTTTSPTRSRASCGPGEASILAAIYGEAFPEAYKEDLPAAAAVADLHRLEALQNKGDIDLALYSPRDAAPQRAPAQAVPRRRTGLAVAGAAAAAGDGRRGRRRAALSDRPGRPPRRVGLRLRAALRAVRRRRLARTRGPASRTRSPPSGPARRRATGSTRWCCGPG